MDVKTLCLGVLTAQDLTGYDIKRTCEEVFRYFFVAGFGSIYPALAELQRDGLVTVTSVEQKKRPDKKVYHITDAGRAALEAELVTTAPRHKVRSEFLALMYFAHLLPPERVDEVLGEMIESFETMLVDDLAVFDGPAGPPELTPGQRFALGFGRTVLAAALAYCKRQRPQLARRLKGGAGLDEAADLPREAANDPAPRPATLAGE
ncbi:MAG: PadR family transcriptional regulator [Geminicoccaceae bacterium]